MLFIDSGLVERDNNASTLSLKPKFPRNFGLNCPRRIASRPNPRNARNCPIRMIGSWLAAQSEAANRTAASGLNGEVQRAMSSVGANFTAAGV